MHCAIQAFIKENIKHIKIIFTTYSYKANVVSSQNKSTYIPLYRLPVSYNTFLVSSICKQIHSATFIVFVCGIFSHGWDKISSKTCYKQLEMHLLSKIP